MIRALFVSTVVATLTLSACGDSDGDDQANSAAAAATTATTATTTTDDRGNVEAWCLGFDSPLPDVEQPISNADLETLYEGILTRDEAMLEVAPAEIAEASQTLVDFGRELNAYLADNDWDPNAPRLEGSNEAEVAGREIDQFAEDNC